MPALDNWRWELFAQARAKGANQQDAYVAAKFEATGEGAISACASRIEAHVEVKDRIREIQARLVKRAQITRLGIMDMLLEDRDKAHAVKQPAAAIRAAELMGKEIGMFVDRREMKAGLMDEENYADLERLRDMLIAESARRLAGGDLELVANEQGPQLLSGPGTAEA